MAKPITNRIVKTCKVWEFKEYNSMFSAGISIKDNNKTDWVNGYVKVWKRDYPEMTLEALNLELAGNYFTIEGSLSFYNGKFEINAAKEPFLAEKVFTKFVFEEKETEEKATTDLESFESLEEMTASGSGVQND